MKLLRFDMSEYTDQYAYTKLIGTAPGYVGYDQGGALTDAVLKEPHAIVLMDEIEKAHPQIYNLLLQVLDYGTLTDGQSRKVDFRHTMIVLTTNAGASVSQKRSIGFGAKNELDQEEAQIEMARVFTPEFRNRFDEIIQFNALPQSVAGHIVDKLVAELQETLTDKNVTIALTESARQWCVENGYDPYMGARPMARLVTNHIKKPLAKELLYGQLKQGGRVVIDVSVENQLSMKFLD
ncbi:MAG: AAA family ATPase [Gammaproteobacteria bacterium]|nr:AAA family ATPase [Gammaproteobacteria bacterium]